MTPNYEHQLIYENNFIFSTKIGQSTISCYNFKQVTTNKPSIPYTQKRQIVMIQNQHKFHRHKELLGLVLDKWRVTAQSPGKTPFSCSSFSLPPAALVSPLKITSLMRKVKTASSSLQHPARKWGHAQENKLVYGKRKEKFSSITQATWTFWLLGYWSAQDTPQPGVYTQNSKPIWPLKQVFKSSYHISSGFQTLQVSYPHLLLSKHLLWK